MPTPFQVTVILCLASYAHGHASLVKSFLEKNQLKAPYKKVSYSSRTSRNLGNVQTFERLRPNF